MTPILDGKLLAQCGDAFFQVVALALREGQDRRRNPPPPRRRLSF
jgi:hypothetical protein